MMLFLWVNQRGAPRILSEIGQRAFAQTALCGGAGETVPHDGNCVVIDADNSGFGKFAYLDGGSAFNNATGECFDQRFGHLRKIQRYGFCNHFGRGPASGLIYGLLDTCTGDKRQCGGGK